MLMLSNAETKHHIAISKDISKQCTYKITAFSKKGREKVGKFETMGILERVVKKRVKVTSRVVPSIFA